MDIFLLLCGEVSPVLLISEEVILQHASPLPVHLCVDFYECAERNDIITSQVLDDFKGMSLFTR